MSTEEDRFDPHHPDADSEETPRPTDGDGDDIIVDTDPYETVLEEEFELDTQELEALTDHLILEAMDNEDDRTPSGLVIPKSAAIPKNGFRRYRVLAAGPYCTDDRTSEFPEPLVEPGDVVLAPADEIGVYREGGITYYICNFDMIAAVIRNG